MADEQQPHPPERPAGGQWGPPPESPPPAAPPPAEPAGETAAPGGGTAGGGVAGPAGSGGWTRAIAPAGRGARWRSLPGPVLAALGVLLAGVLSVLAALVDMVQADDVFGGEFGPELGFLDRVAIGMGRLDVRLALLLPLALVLVRPALESRARRPAEDQPVRLVVAGTAFLAGALLFLIALNLVASMADDRFTFTSTAAALFDNLAGLVVAAAAGGWAWRELQHLGDAPPAAAPAGPPGEQSAWPPAPGSSDPYGAANPPPAAPAEPAEQERRWGPPPV